MALLLVLLLLHVCNVLQRPLLSSKLPATFLGCRAVLAAAKASKKNQKRTAKRREEAGSQWDTSSANGSTTDTSGMPPLEEVLGPGAVEAEGSVASGGRFITGDCLIV